MRATYTTRMDGEWFPVLRRGQILGCCDCKLVHRINFKIVKGRIYMQAFREEQRTAARRRKK